MQKFNYSKRLLDMQARLSAQDYCDQAKVSQSQGLTIKAALQFYMGLKKYDESAAEVHCTIRDPSLRKRHYKDYINNGLDIATVNMAEKSIRIFTSEQLHEQKPEVLKIIQTFPEEQQNELLREPALNRKDCLIGMFFASKKGLVDSEGCFSEQDTEMLQQVSAHLQKISKIKQSRNAVWLLQVGNKLVQDGVISLDVFLHITSFILPAHLKANPKDVFTKVHNSRLPQNIIFFHSANDKIAREKYLQRTKDILNETEQKDELAKFKL